MFYVLSRDDNLSNKLFSLFNIKWRFWKHLLHTHSSHSVFWPVYHCIRWLIANIQNPVNSPILNWNGHYTLVLSLVHYNKLFCPNIQDLRANSNLLSLSNAYGWAGDSRMDAAFDRSDNLESTASRPLEPGSGRAEAAHMITLGGAPTTGW